jgi:CBS-domain-containing membrane protein
MKGKLRGTYNPLSIKYAIWGFLASTVAILAILLVTKICGHPLLIGSFGASAVLLFGAAENPLAQPRNLIGGHFVSALVAVVAVAFGATGPLGMSLAVGISILVMYLTRTIHPPGGATALIGVQGHAGLVFLLVPVLSGTLILLLVALFLNNAVHHRQYPKNWL